MMSKHVQVQKFLEQLKPKHPELQSAKMMICQNFATNFAGACMFFSSIVSSVYGAAQIEYRHNRLQKCKISSVHHGSQDKAAVVVMVEDPADAVTMSMHYVQMSALENIAHRQTNRQR